MAKKKKYCPVSGYSCNYSYRHGCRCSVCTDALRERCYATIERRKASRAAKLTSRRSCSFPDNKPYTGYQYGCRCVRCCRGQADAVARYRKRRKEREDARQGGNP